jgi:hypothetical protein
MLRIFLRDTWWNEGRNPDLDEDAILGIEEYSVQVQLALGASEIGEAQKKTVNKNLLPRLYYHHQFVAPHEDEMVDTEESIAG